MTEAMSLMVFVGLIYLVAGTIKGLLGLGLPTTALTLLSVLVGPLQALAINLVPMFIANIWQFSRAEDSASLIKRYRLFAASLMLSILAVSFVTARLPTSYLQLIIAGTVILFALYNLLQKPVPLSSRKDTLWQVVFGLAAGVMGALTSMWAVPLVMYLLSLKLSPRAFVDAAGFLLLVGCVPLSIGYLATGLVTSEVIGPAIIGTIGALAGFQLGAYLRAFVNASLFRRLLLWFFLAMGVRMAFLSLPAL